MKKVALSVIVSLVAVFALPLSVNAAPGGNSGKTTVEGTVTLASNGSPVKNANVSVTCDGNTITGTTNGSGAYKLDYADVSLCPDGSTAFVTVTAAGGYSGKGQAMVTQQEASVNNIGMVDVTVALPEMGVITAIAAAVVGAGVFLVVRRRNLSAVQE